MQHIDQVPALHKALMQDMRPLMIGVGLLLPEGDAFLMEGEDEVVSACMFA